MTLLSAGDIALMHTTLLELANATLLRIEAPASIDAYGDPTLATVWSGTARGTLERQDRDLLSAGVEVRAKVDTFLVYDQAGAPVASMLAGADWEAAAVVIRDERLTTPVTRRWTITELEHEANHTLDSVLMTLNADAATT